MSDQLSDQQLAFMRVLWSLGEATTQQVHQALVDDGHALAPTTVATVLARLERRGLITHRTRGRQFVFSARVSESQVRRSMLARLTDFFFGGDTAALVSHLAEDRSLSEDDLQHIKQLLAERDTKESEEDSHG
jgi:BlaI family penicillinase repressor